MGSDCYHVEVVAYGLDDAVDAMARIRDAVEQYQQAWRELEAEQ